LKIKPFSDNLNFVLYLGYCLTVKSHNCNDIPAINITHILSDASYYGVNDSAVNSSLTSIGTWSNNEIQLLCKRKLKQTLQTNEKPIFSLYKSQRFLWHLFCTDVVVVV